MKDNKFLTGFLIVTLLGAGALGFLLFQAKGKHTEATTAYSEKVSELQSLQGGKPYPDDANYQKVLDLQKAHQQAINDLQKQLAKAEFPLNPVTPVKFQDNLNEALKRVRALAAQKGTVIDGADKFSLGFELYQTQPPKNDVSAAALDRMLRSIEEVVNALLNTAPTTMKDIKRTPLPEEGLPGQKAAPATPTPKPGVGGKKSTEEQPLVKRYPFEIEFVAHEPKVRAFINQVVENKTQFFALSSVKIANMVPVGPSKAAAAAPPPPPPPPDGSAPAGGTPPAPSDQATQTPPPPAEGTKFIVGEEKLSVVVVVEVVDFAEPPAEKTAATPVKPAPAKPAPAK